jgi:hypothetical protein
MSNWQAEQAERNRKSLARLTKALPAIFPPAVLARTQPPIHTPDAAVGDRFILPRASNPR